MHLRCALQIERDCVKHLRCKSADARAAMLRASLENSFRVEERARR